MGEELRDGRRGGSGSARAQRGQAATEFAISAVVLLLILCGLLDLSRVFYFQVDAYGAAREGARTGAWFDVPTRMNPQLDDADILSAVSDTLQGAGLPRVTTNSAAGAGCLTSTNGNSYRNPPYDAGNYPTTVNSPKVYLCYTPPGVSYAGCSLGSTAVSSLATRPGNDCWRLGDINVAILMQYGFVTPLLQNLFGSGANMVGFAHVEIQGKP